MDIDTSTLLLTLSEWLGVVAVILILGMSQRPDRHPLVFRYPRREGLVALGLAGLVFLLSLWFYNGPGIALLAETGLGSGLLITRLALAGLSVLAAGAFLLVRRQPLRSAGWKRGELGMAVRWAITLVFLSVFLRGRIFALLDGVSAVEGQALLLWALIALAEETVFRGFIQLRLSAWLGNLPGLLLTAALFFLCQLPRLAGTPSPGTGLLIAAGQALVLGWVMQRSRHVLAPALYRAVSEWMYLL